MQTYAGSYSAPQRVVGSASTFGKVAVRLLGAALSVVVDGCAAGVASPSAVGPTSTLSARGTDSQAQYQLVFELPRTEWRTSDAITGGATLSLVGPLPDQLRFLGQWTDHVRVRRDGGQPARGRDGDAGLPDLSARSRANYHVTDQEVGHGLQRRRPAFRFRPLVRDRSLRPFACRQVDDHRKCRCMARHLPDRRHCDPPRRRHWSCERLTRVCLDRLNFGSSPACPPRK